MSDLTLIHYTSNSLPEHFAARVRQQILRAAPPGTPIVSVSHKPLDFGYNICIGPCTRSFYQLYAQVLLAAKTATTPYVATVEDDVLYPAEHFWYRPPPGVFAYDINKWAIYTWYQPPLFSYKPRRTMTSLIVSRDALVATLEERFARWPDPTQIDVRYWGEPGRFENHLKITPLKNEMFASPTPSIVFCTKEALGYGELGWKKRHSDNRSTSLPYWGSAAEVLKWYEDPTLVV